MVEHDAAASTGFKIADNRTAELAEWDYDILGLMVGEIQHDSPELFDELLLAELQSPAEEKNAEAKDIPDVFKIVITCIDKKHQRHLMRKFKKEGLCYEVSDN